MKRMKTFFKYFLIILIFYIVSDIISYMLLKSNYIPKDYEIGFSEPQITVDEMKSTILNGYTKGTITNNTNATLIGKALRLDYYSKNRGACWDKILQNRRFTPRRINEF